MSLNYALFTGFLQQTPPVVLVPDCNSFTVFMETFPVVGHMKTKAFNEGSAAALEEQHFCLL